MRIGLENHFAPLSWSWIRLRTVVDLQTNLHGNLTELSRQLASVAFGSGGRGFAVSRGFLLSFIALGLVLAVLFAAFPVWDLEVAQYFFDPKRARFPLSISYEWNLIRQAAKALPIARGRRLRAAAEARVAGAEDGGRPVSRALSARLVPDRPWRDLKSPAEGELGQAAA